MVLGRGSIRDGRRVYRGNCVVAMISPQKQAIPRHIVSTSGSSGIVHARKVGFAGSKFVKGGYNST